MDLDPDHELFIGKASEVCDFLMDLARYEVSRDFPLEDFAYGQALVLWERRGRGARDYFSTTDPFLLRYAKALEERFGLPVVERKEGLARETGATIRTWVNGFEPESSSPPKGYRN